MSRADMRCLQGRAFWIDSAMRYDQRLRGIGVACRAVFDDILLGCGAIPAIAVVSVRNGQFPDETEYWQRLAEVAALNLVDYEEDTNTGCIVARLPGFARYFMMPSPQGVVGWFKKWQVVPGERVKNEHTQELRNMVSGIEPLRTAWDETFGRHQNGQKVHRGSQRPEIPSRLRFQVFQRDGFRCRYCGASPPEVVLVCDHLDPHTAGGATNLANLITSCKPCNDGKGDRPVRGLA